MRYLQKKKCCAQVLALKKHPTLFLLKSHSESALQSGPGQKTRLRLVKSSSSLIFLAGSPRHNSLGVCSLLIRTTPRIFWLPKSKMLLLYYFWVLIIKVIPEWKQGYIYLKPSSVRTFFFKDRRCIVSYHSLLSRDALSNMICAFMEKHAGNNKILPSVQQWCYRHTKITVDIPVTQHNIFLYLKQFH